MNLAAPLRHEAAFDAELAPYRDAADRVMLGMCAFLEVVCLLIAPVRGEWLAALAIGGGTLAVAAWLARHAGGTLTTRLYMGCAFMVYTGLVIHETGGSIEGHFTAFGLIGVLLYYRDWRVIASATVFIYLHHLVLGYAQLRGLPVYVFDTREYWYKFAIHVAYFLPFVGLMGYLAIGLRREGFENRRVIRLAREVADGDFTHQSGFDHGEADGLLGSVRNMRDSVLSLVRCMPGAVMIVRLGEDQVADVNDAWCRLFGLRAADVVGQGVGALPVWAADAPWAACVGQFGVVRDGQAGGLLEMPMRRADGGAFNAVANAVRHRTARLELLIIGFEDVTLRREAERRMHQLAYHDALTGLHNRAALVRHLEGLLADRRADRRARAGALRGLAVMLLDLDDFKPINDTHGHDAGDRVLATVARRIDETRREGDFAARLGGDEFVVLLTDCGDVDEALHVARRMQRAIAEPVVVRDGLACQVGVTLGIAWYAHGTLPAGVEAALDAADRSLYDGKRAGKGAVRAHVIDAGGGNAVTVGYVEPVARDRLPAGGPAGRD